MSNYSSLPSYSSGGGSDNARLMDQMRSQVAVASAQELIQVIINLFNITALCSLLHRKCLTSVSESAFTLPEMSWTQESKWGSLKCGNFYLCFCRNACRCVWIATWRHGTLHQNPIVLNFKTKNINLLLLIISFVLLLLCTQSNYQEIKVILKRYFFHVFHALCLLCV